MLKPRPLPGYMAWLRAIPRAEQFTSAVVVGELFKGAYRSADAPRHLRNIETRVLPAVSVLPYDVEVARVYGVATDCCRTDRWRASPRIGALSPQLHTS